MLLLKPQTFVNLSGATVVAAMTFYKVPLSEVLIIVDDIHLPLGHLRLRPNGSAGGHNGLRDIEQSIGIFTMVIVLFFSSISYFI